MGPRKQLLDGVQIVPREGAIFRVNNMLGHARRQSAVSWAQMAEPIEMPFGLWTRVGTRKHGGVRTGAT